MNLSKMVSICQHAVSLLQEMRHGERILHRSKMILADSNRQDDVVYFFFLAHTIPLLSLCLRKILPEILSHVTLDKLSVYKFHKQWKLYDNYKT